MSNEWKAVLEVSKIRKAIRGALLNILQINYPYNVVSEPESELNKFLEEYSDLLGAGKDTIYQMVMDQVASVMTKAILEGKNQHSKLTCICKVPQKDRSSDSPPYWTGEGQS